jgi:serine/threonine protein kinase
MPFLRPEERAGTVIAEKYRLDRVLGRGGMGVVLAGEHLWTDRSVAVKILAPELSEDEQVVQRFLHEAKAAARLKHPNVVDVLDMGKDEEGLVYLVLELLEGESLAARLERTTTIDPKSTVEIAIPILDALAHAHEKGIVHRDIKPDNVFLSVDARGRMVPKLLDFGIAKIRDAGGKGTKTGTVIGTPSYMSPEQALAEAPVGPATDVWSMGVVLYEALCGQLPYQAETMTGTLAAILTTDPKRLRERAPELPEGIASVVDRAMARDPIDRYPDARVFSIALYEMAAKDGIEPGGIDDVLRAIRAFGPTEQHALPREEPISRRDSSESMRTVDVMVGDAPPIAKLDAVSRTHTPAAVEPKSARWPYAVAIVLGLALAGVVIAYVALDPDPPAREVREVPVAAPAEEDEAPEPLPAPVDPPVVAIDPPAVLPAIAPSIVEPREARPRREPREEAPREEPAQAQPDRGANDALILD